MRLFFRLAALAALTLPLVSLADVDQGTDHPALNRFPQAHIDGYSVKNLEPITVILSKPYERSGRLTVDKKAAVEGRVTYLHYTHPAQVSTLEVFRHFKQQLSSKGFELKFVCNRPCTGASGGSWAELIGTEEYVNGFQQEQFLTAKKGDTWVMLRVNELDGASAFLFVVEPPQAGLPVTAGAGGGSRNPATDTTAGGGNAVDQAVNTVDKAVDVVNKLRSLF